MKIFFVILSILSWQGIVAQKDIELFKNDPRGRPLYLITNYPTEGSPYFNDDYQVAQLTIMGGAVYNNVRVKLNLLEHLVQYLKPDGTEMITEMPVQTIRFINTHAMLESQGGALNVPGAGIYEVLDTGQVKLLKKIVILSRDNKSYNDAAITRIFERKETYYSQTANGELKKLEKGRQAMLDLFSSKRDSMALFIDQHHLNCKSETDYRAVFAFYNSLQ